MARLKDAGAAGARIVGGGFGGSVLALFAPERDAARRRARRRAGRAGAGGAGRHLGWAPARTRARAVTEGMRHRLLLLALTALLIVPAAAQAADSHAPHGARLDWLPSDEWVMSAWLPYDEARLYALIHSDRAEVDAWLDDHRTLGQLARTARLDLAAQAGPRARRAAPEVRAPGDAPVLERRALETLTQGHLSNHVIFHVFHTPAIADHARRLRPAPGHLPPPARQRPVADAIASAAGAPAPAPGAPRA